jgi:CRISPR-associated protein Cmr5
MTAERTLEQKRAAHALLKVRRVESTPSAPNYRSYAESLPATIVTNGLGQACATLLARANGRKDDAHYLLYAHLEEWLCRSEDPVFPQANALIEAIVKNDQRRYVRAQAEALAYLVWLKKFAQAFLKKASTSEGDGDAK